MEHVKGEWAGSRITLEDWQIFIYASGWGWLRRDDGFRRYREMYVEVPRKNAKSTMAAIAGHYMAWADGEPGAEVYAGACTEAQAWEVFEPALWMARNDDEFRNHFGIHVGARIMSCMDTMSKFKPLIGKPKKGGSPHLAIVDEYHEHPTKHLFDTMQTGMGARRQPMMLTITTGGTNLSAPCYAKRNEAIKVLGGLLPNDKFFAIIYTIDEKGENGVGDDWTDPESWIKANPNYGVSVKKEFLDDQRQKAIAIASEQNDIKCWHLNIWSGASKSWINLEQWKACARPLDLQEFLRDDCWVGVDLASKIDLTSMMFLFRRMIGETAKYFLFSKHYIAEETAKLPGNEHWRRWIAQGYLKATPGYRTDYRYLKDDLLEMNDWLIIKGLGYDPHETEMLMQEVRDDVAFDCIEITQAPSQMSEPMKEFEAIYTNGDLQYDGNPLTTWAASNVVLRSTKTKKYYPGKEFPENKIDPIVAAIMALKLAMAAEDERSVYEERGLLTV